MIPLILGLKGKKYIIPKREGAREGKRMLLTDIPKLLDHHNKRKRKLEVLFVTLFFKVRHGVEGAAEFGELIQTRGRGLCWPIILYSLPTGSWILPFPRVSEMLYKMPMLKNEP